MAGISPRRTRPRRKRWLAAAAVLLAIAAGAVAAVLVSRGASATAPSGNLPGWRQVFVENFDGPLRAQRWGRYSGQPGGDPGGYWAPSHAVVSNGALRLESYRDPRYGDRWVSGGVSSAPALRQTYGKYVVRFRIDGGKGIAGVLLLWPSGNGWPPEIDFAEDGGAGAGRDTMTATLHYGAQNATIQRTVSADFTRWHTMGVEWTPGTLTYTLDGKPWASVHSSHVPSQPMELDLQTQTGTCGDPSAPCPDASTPSHVTMDVDWVVAYAYRPGAGGAR